MDLNQVRLLEACHRYLVDRVHIDIKENMLNDKLVFEFNGDFVTFNTYQEVGHCCFYEYELGSYEELENHRSIDVTEILSILNLKSGQIGTLSMLTDITRVRAYIFKILSQADFAKFEKEIKNTNFAYNFRYVENYSYLPCVKIDKDKLFNFVSIIW